MSWDYEADVAIVGAGGCGLMTALVAARNADATVVVFEKDRHLLSNTEISSGTLAAGGTRFQAELGIVDSPERYMEDIQRKNGGQSDPDIVLALCRAAPRYVEWLADDLDYPIELAIGMPRVGHTTDRLHTDAPRDGGGALIACLRSAVEELPNVILVDHTPGTGLVDHDGSVTGLTIEENGEPMSVRAGAVVLACDGFGANRSMVAEFCREIADAEYIGVEGNTGDGVRWGMQAGAAVDHMSSYQGHGHVIVGYGTRVNPGVPLLGGIVLSQAGRRFVREDQGYSEFAGQLLRLAQPNGRALEVWDERIMDQVRETELMRESTDAGAYKRFDDWESLAVDNGLPPDVVLDEVTAYHAGIAAGRDGLGRTYIGEPLTPPLYAAWITGALAHTQGGLRVDALGRVLRDSGDPIRGLYAGGGTAAGVSGDGCDGYLSGNGLLSALGFGFLIGEHLSSSIGVAT